MLEFSQGAADTAGLSDQQFNTHLFWDDYNKLFVQSD